MRIGLWGLVGSIPATVIGYALDGWGTFIEWILWPFFGMGLLERDFTPVLWFAMGYVVAALTAFLLSAPNPRS